MGYDFSDALRLVKAGERVRRASWPAAWLYLAEGGPAEGPDKVYLVERHPGEADERASEFVARDAELMAADWMVVGEKAVPDPSADVPPGMTFADFAREFPPAAARLRDSAMRETAEEVVGELADAKPERSDRGDAGDPNAGNTPPAGDAT